MNDIYVTKNATGVSIFSSFNKTFSICTSNYPHKNMVNSCHNKGGPLVQAENWIHVKLSL